MQNLVLPSLCLILTEILLPVHSVKAAWAAHEIIDWENASTKYPIAVDLTEDKTQVRIFLPVKREETIKGYFVIRSKERLSQNDLEFRMSMSQWRQFQQMHQEARESPHLASVYAGESYRSHFKKFYADVERFEEMSHIEPETRDGAHGIFLDLKPEVALRTYIFYDFLPWGGSGVRDGGLWLTYDIPTFVENLGSGEASRSEAGKDGDQFRIRDVLMDEEKQTFRVQIEKLSPGDLNLRDLGVKLRIWERTPDGNLALADPKAQPEWATVSLKWKDSEVKDLLWTWDGPDPDSDNVYHGFSADIIYANQLEDSWATSPDLLTHLLAVESLDTTSTELTYKLHPERVYFEMSRARKEITRAARLEGGVINEKALREILEVLESLYVDYPDWQYGLILQEIKNTRAMLANRRMESDTPGKAGGL